jgi:hypothetical protein
MPEVLLMPQVRERITPQVLLMPLVLVMPLVREKAMVTGLAQGKDRAGA